MISNFDLLFRICELPVYVSSVSCTLSLFYCFSDFIHLGDAFVESKENLESENEVYQHPLSCILAQGSSVSSYCPVLGTERALIELHSAPKS